MKILLVEDNFDTAHIFQSYLTHLGHQSFIVAWGESAPYYAKRYHPDVILMDIRLPGRMDGIQAAEAINNALHIPVIFLTVHAEMQDEAMRVKNYGFLLKTCTPKELQVAIEWAVKAKEQNFSQEQHIKYLEQVVEQRTDLLKETFAHLDLIQQRYDNLLAEVVNTLFGLPEEHGTLERMMNDYEQFLLIKVLLRYRDIDAAARELGLHRATLYRKCKKYAINVCVEDAKK